MKRHILNIFCGIVCTAVLWSLLSCSNGNEVNSVSGYYVNKGTNSNGQETIDYIADFKSVPGKVATFRYDDYSDKPTRKLMDYVPYTVSGDTITFQNVKKFEPGYSSSGEGKTMHGRYDSSTNTLYLPSNVWGGSNPTVDKEFVPSNEAFFENVAAGYYYNQYSLSSEYYAMKVDKITKTVTIREGETYFSPYDENYEINNFDQYGEVFLGPVPYEVNGKGISLKNNSKNITLEWSYDYYDAIGRSIEIVLESSRRISLDRSYSY